MPVEVATSIEDLDVAWPLGGDVVDRGDDHLRLIKSVLQVQFPGVSGNGFAIPITATEAEINNLTGLTGNVQSQFDALDGRVTGLEGALSAAVGTRMAFHQAASPTGWTQDATLDNHMLRVIDTAGGGSGGTDSPIAAHTHTGGDHILTVTELPAHAHDSPWTNGLGATSASLFTGRVTSAPLTTYEDVTAADDAYGTNDLGEKIFETTGTGSGDTHNHGETLAGFTPKYVDMIIASKD